MTFFALRKTFSAAAISVVMFAGTAPVVAGNNVEGNDTDARLVIYFTRHAEKQTYLKEFNDNPVDTYTSSLDENGNVVFSVNGSSFGSNLEICGTGKCAEVLSKQGEKRAMLLADWFAGRGITDKLDAVYATHKTRTQQTVMPTATAAGMAVTILNPDFSELNPESTTPSECSTLEAIQGAQADGLDTILIAGHSGTLYDIMGNGVSDCGNLDGLGLDTGNLDRFPKDSDGKVRDFGDIWKVIIKRNGDVRFGYRVNLQQPDRLTIDNAAR